MSDVLQLVEQNDPVLRAVAEPCVETEEWINEHVIPHVYPMKALMNAHRGIGLAAPQVGISRRFFLMRDSMGCHLVINPVIKAIFGVPLSRPEMCLSFPGRTAMVIRQEFLHVGWCDSRGKRREMKLNGMAGRVFQHETDHLNGICIFQ